MNFYLTWQCYPEKKLGLNFQRVCWFLTFGEARTLRVVVLILGGPLEDLGKHRVPGPP